jgi:hypothetical protein
MNRAILMVTLLAIAAVAAPAAAHDGRGPAVNPPSPSVFPPPRDPWRSWGVRSELPRRVGPPRVHAREGVVVLTPGPGAVWVAGHWVWDGATWVWWPGHWGIR